MSMIERIITLLDTANIKASKLTSDLELSNSAITDWKKGKGKPSTEAIIKISKYFNVTTDWLLTGEGEMNKQTIDIQPKFLDEEKLDIGEKLLLKKYNQLDEADKIEILDIITLKTLKGLKSKLYHSDNAEDEIVTAYELERIAS